MRSTRLRWFGPRFFAFIGAMALALSVTVAASADTATKHVTFDHEAMIGGAKLSAGDYGLVIDGGQLTVKQGKRVVAQAPAHWEARDATPDANSVLYGENNKVIEIRFAHQRDVLIIATP